ncbi:MAG: TIM barrel protein [Clostridia bacterium]|nr:TIM barrel protein [Clostridia bacterium]
MKIAVFYENIYDGAKALNRPMDETLSSLRDAGMKLIYISADSFRRDRTWLQPLLRELGLGIEGMHAFCDFSGEPDTLKYRELIDLACECGAGNLLFVPGMLSGKNTLKDFEAIAAGMRRAVDYGRSKGMPILMEDFDGLRAPYNSILSLHWFMENVEGLGCAFDTGNFVMFHEDELEAYELFRSKIVTLHLKDRSNAPRHPDDHPYTCADGAQVFTCTVGSGFIRMTEILKRLAASGYRGNVIAELYGEDHAHILDDIYASVEYLKGQGIGERKQQ